MSTNLPRHHVERFCENPDRGSLIGRTDLRRYYAVRGSAPSDVAIVSLRGKPDEPAYTRKGSVQHDYMLHGRITAERDTPAGELAWREWIGRQPRTKGKRTPAAVPESITLGDVVQAVPTKAPSWAQTTPGDIIEDIKAMVDDSMEALRTNSDAHYGRPDWTDTGVLVIQSPPDSPELRSRLAAIRCNAPMPILMDSADYPPPDMSKYALPKLADVCKDAHGNWVIAGFADLGTFASRDGARAAVRACKCK